MGSKSAPSAPDPYQTAAAQTQSNEQTASYNQQLNMLDTSSPYGTVSYAKDANAPGGYSQTTTLSPAEQAIFNQQTAAQGGALGIANSQLGRVSTALGQSVNPSSYGALQSSAFGGALYGDVFAPSLQSGYGNGAPVQTGYNPGGQVQGGYGSGGGIDYGIGQQGPISTSYGAGGSIQTGLGSQGPMASSYSLGGPIQMGVGAAGSSQAVTDAENAAYGSQATYLDPQFQQQGQALQAQLAAQGLNPNDAAYQNAMQSFGSQENQAYQGARDSAVTAGQNEQNTLYGQALQSGQFANAAQSQQASENAGLAAFGNEAQQQRYEQALGAGTFANSAQAQANQENAAAAAFQNSGQQQGYAQSLGMGDFYDQAQAQANSQSAAAAAFGNSAQAQRNSQAAAAAGFNNSAAAQQYSQAQGDASFYDTAANSGYQDLLSAAGLQNSEQSQAYQEAYQNAQLGNTAQQQAFNEGTYAQTLPVNELASLMGLGQVSGPTGISYQPSQAANTDVIGAVQNSFQDQEQNYQQQMSQGNAILGGLFGLGAAGIKASDVRLKDDVRPVGRLDNGLTVYAYRYKGSLQTEIGVLAQEVARVRPDAVHRHPSGFLMVDYGAL